MEKRWKIHSKEKVLEHNNISNTDKSNEKFLSKAFSQNDFNKKIIKQRKDNSLIKDTIYVH